MVTVGYAQAQPARLQQKWDSKQVVLRHGAASPAPLAAEQTTAGKKALSVRTLAGWDPDIVGEAIEGFQLKRIRPGVETLLAANYVSREVRGHLQSHGLTGVQARHYCSHNYMPEERRRSRCWCARCPAARPPVLDE